PCAWTTPLARNVAPASVVLVVLVFVLEVLVLLLVFVLVLVLVFVVLVGLLVIRRRQVVGFDGQGDEEAAAQLGHPGEEIVERIRELFAHARGGALSALRADDGFAFHQVAEVE